MLDRRNHALRLDARNCRAAEQPRMQRVFAQIFEGAAATWIADQVDAAREQDIEPLGMGFAADQRAALAHEVGAPCRAHRHSRRKRGRPVAA